MFKKCEEFCRGKVGLFGGLGCPPRKKKSLFNCDFLFSEAV